MTVAAARLFATLAHDKQKYGSKPYMYHVEKTVSFLKKYTSDETMIIAAYLHDVVEDTGTSLAEIEEIFGKRVRDIVDGVTDEPGETRAIRKHRTLAKTARLAGSVAVKLADRLANVTEGEKTEMYQKEYSEFKKILYKQSHPTFIKRMWIALDNLLLSADKRAA